MIQYVVGFLFDIDYSTVVLIRKTKPEWQAGRLNGVGGKIVEGETPQHAMQREFMEETSVFVEASRWKEFGKLVGEGYVVHCFRASSIQVDSVRTVTDEEVRVVYIDKLHHHRTLDNLPWLVQMALSNDPTHLTVHYNDESTNSSKVHAGERLHG